MAPRKHTISTILIIGISLALNLCLYAQTTHQKIKEYIAAHKEKAIEQMALFNIPASITMAQAIKESAFGTSNLATSSNNHFGIKCHKEWGGSTTTQDDDSLNECFRKYNSIEDSYFDHSMFLRSRPRYEHLFKLKPTDYFGWCIGLKRAGYATASNYTDELLYIIEVYDLHELDKVQTLNNSITLSQLLNDHQKSTVTKQENWLAKAEKHILAKVIFNVIEIEEEPLFVRGNTLVKNAD